MRYVPLLLIFALLAVGCGPEEVSVRPDPKPPTTTVEADPEPPPDPPAPKTTDAPDASDSQPVRSTDGQRAVMAYVNGEPIYMDALHDLLVKTYGLKISNQLIANELVRQEAALRKVTITEKDVQRESEETFDRIIGVQVQGADREEILQQLLDQRGLTELEWNLTMRRNALLRKIAGKNVAVSQAMIRDEFDRVYGTKAVVRHIEVGTLAEAREILQQLKKGADFAQLAYKKSVNASAADGGLLPPISAQSRMVPLSLREAALALDEPGDLSDPIKVETRFHILRLEKTIEPKDVKLDEVRDKLAESIRSRLAAAEGQRILRKLLAEAHRQELIEYVDPGLKKQAREQRKKERTR